MSGKLTDQQKRFCEEYIVDTIAAHAAVRAGYSSKGAKVTASRLMDNLAVKACIQELMDKRAEKVGLTAERVLAEIQNLAFLDPADVVGSAISKPEDIGKLPEHVRRAIVGWDYDAKGNFRLKFADKKGSLELLGRHLKLFTDVVDNRHTFTQMGRVTVEEGKQLEYQIGEKVEQPQP